MGSLGDKVSVGLTPGLTVPPTCTRKNSHRRGVMSHRLCECDPTTINQSIQGTTLRLRSSKSTAYATFENDLIDSTVPVALAWETSANHERDQQDPRKKGGAGAAFGGTGRLRRYDTRPTTMRIRGRIERSARPRKCEWPLGGACDIGTETTV